MFFELDINDRNVPVSVAGSSVISCHILRKNLGVCDRYATSPCRLVPQHI